MKRVPFFGLALVVFCVAFGGGARAGTIVADSGFRPDTDGFSFENYGNENGYANLNAAEMVRMYGREACLSPRGRCVLDPGLRNFMEYLNDAFDGGHCFGFAALSELIYAGRLPDFGYPSISSFGKGSRTYDLSISNSLLQRSIARAASFQVYPAVDDNLITGAPNRVLNALGRKLTAVPREAWNISIRRRDGKGGHAITPYAIEDMGGGISHVHVYDNNWPGDDKRRLIVNRNENTWSYYAATKPGNEQAMYEGDATTKTFRIKPIGPALGVQPCPFCTGRKGASMKRNAISLSSASLRHSRLLLIDSRGRRTGFLNGRYINRISGIRMLKPDTGLRFAAAGGRTPKPILDSAEPIYMVPRGLRLKIKVTGRGDKPVGAESVNVAGPSFDASVDRLRATRKRPVLLEFVPRTSSLRMIRAGRGKGLSARVGAHGRGAGFQVGYDLDDAGPRSRLRMVRDHRSRTLALKLSPTAGQDLLAFLVRFDKKRTRFEAEYTLRRGERAAIRFGPAIRRQSARLVIRDRAGRVSQSLPLLEVDE